MEDIAKKGLKFQGIIIITYYLFKVQMAACFFAVCNFLSARADVDDTNFLFFFFIFVPKLN